MAATQLPWTTPRVNLVPGGPSSAGQINEFCDGVTRDLAVVQQVVQQFGSDLKQGLAGLSQQLTVLAGYLAGLSPGSWTVSFHSKAQLEPENTAQIDPLYGQATLPILGRFSQTQLWSGREVYVPDQVQVLYRAGSESTGWRADPNARACLTGRPWDCWVRQLDELEGPIELWVRLELARTVLSPINCIEWIPFPACSLELLGASLALAGNQELELPLTDLTGYDSGSGTVPNVGPCRWLVTGRAVRAVTFHLKGTPSNGTLWYGCKFLRVSRAVFRDQAKLAVNVTGSSSVNSCTVHGSYSGQPILNQPRTGCIELNLAPLPELPSPIITGLTAS